MVRRRRPRQRDQGDRAGAAGLDADRILIEADISHQSSVEVVSRSRQSKSPVEVTSREARIHMRKRSQTPIAALCAAAALTAAVARAQSRVTTIRPALPSPTTAANMTLTAVEGVKVGHEIGRASCRERGEG